MELLQYIAISHIKKVTFDEKLHFSSKEPKKILLLTQTPDAAQQATSFFYSGGCFSVYRVPYPPIFKVNAPHWLTPTSGRTEIRR